MTMHLFRPKFHTFICFLLCVSSMNVPLIQYKIYHTVEAKIGNHRQESGPRVRRQASDIRSKYLLPVTYEPINYHLKSQFSRNSVPTEDNSDVSAILKGYAIYMKQDEPVEEISKFADAEDSKAINVEQESIYKVRPDELHEFGSDSSEYEFKKYSKPFYDNPADKEYIWQDHQHLNNEDDYKYHDDGHLYENHEGIFKNHDGSERETGELNYGFKTSFHKCFHGSYDDEHHSDYDGNGDNENDRHEANFVLGDYDHVWNNENVEDFGKNQDHKFSKANGFYNVFHKDEFQKARDFYNNENEGGRFYKNVEHKKLFEDSEGKIKKESQMDFSGGGRHSKKRGSGVRGMKERQFKEGDGTEGHEEYHNERKSHEKKGRTHRRKYDFLYR